MLAQTVNTLAVHFENFLSFGTKRQKNFTLVSIIIKKTVKALATGLSFPDQTIHPTLSKRTKTAGQADRLEKVGLSLPVGSEEKYPVTRESEARIRYIAKILQVQ
jgi:hypothetical protein